MIDYRAALYNKQILPIWQPLPSGFTVDFFDANYSLQDKEDMFAISAFHTISVNLDSNKKDIFVEKINGVYWTNDQIIIDILSDEGSQFIHIEGDGSEQKYILLKEAEFNQMQQKIGNSVFFDHPPFIIKYWWLLVICLVVVCIIIWLLYSK